MNRVTIIALLVIGLATGCKETGQPRSAGIEAFDQNRKSDTLVIIADDGKKHSLDVYLALDYEEKRQGLMHVLTMPETTGMLFVYETADLHSMWMKNTFIPLDMVFARADGSVATVIHNAQPHSLKSQAATEPVTYVLELNAGVARQLNIGLNSRIIWDGQAE